MRSVEPGIAARAVRPVLAGLRVLRHDDVTLAASAGIRAEDLSDPDSRIPHSSMMALWQKAVVATGDDDLGLHLAEASPIETFELPAYAFLAAPALRAGYRTAARYQRLIHEATLLTFEESAQRGTLRHGFPGGGAVPRQPAEFLSALWVRLGRMLTGDHWVPEVVTFAHPQPRGTKEHVRIFGKTVQFSSASTSMTIPASILDRPNPRRDAALLELLERYAQKLLAVAPDRTSNVTAVRSQLARELCEGTATAEHVASTLGMSVRSLHRALKVEGTTFREILEQVRKEEALRILAGRSRSIPDAAFLLGFSELSSFYRAFKRWTGKTPAQYRAAALSDRDN